MTKPIEWNIDPHKLMSPFQGDNGKQITEITFSPISHADHVKTLEGDPSEREAFGRIAMAACDLSAGEISRLSSPDWNSICTTLSEMVSKSAPFFIDQIMSGRKPSDRAEYDPDNPILLVPIKSDSGKPVTSIKLKIPSVQSRDLMEAQEESKRTMFINMDCTGLSEAELGRLSVPDWNHLQSRINDFLNETADFFLPET